MQAILTINWVVLFKFFYQIFEFSTSALVQIVHTNSTYCCRWCIFRESAAFQVNRQPPRKEGANYNRRVLLLLGKQGANYGTIMYGIRDFKNCGHIRMYMAIAVFQIITIRTHTYQTGWEDSDQRIDVKD